MPILQHWQGWIIEDDYYNHNLVRRKWRMIWVASVIPGVLNMDTTWTWQAKETLQAWMPRSVQLNHMDDKWWNTCAATAERFIPICISGDLPERIIQENRKLVMQSINVLLQTKLTGKDNSAKLIYITISLHCSICGCNNTEEMCLLCMTMSSCSKEDNRGIYSPC